MTVRINVKRKRSVIQIMFAILPDKGAADSATVGIGELVPRAAFRAEPVNFDGP